MHLDFSDVDDVEDYLSVPAGRYNCRIAEVREGWTRDGDQRWSFRLEVADGDFAGRTAAWDGLSWSKRGMKRAKYVLQAFGFEVEGGLELEPNDLVGATAIADVQAEDRTDPNSGLRTIRPRIPFMGYENMEVGRA